MVIEKAYAKVNLFINVIGARRDGYHDLEMINTKIDLYDTVKIEELNSPGLVIVKSNDLFLSNQNNLVIESARYMIKEYAPDKGVTVTIDKVIPFGAGLAGNSVDAAAIIRGINKLFNLNISMEEMQKLGVKFGADIPYCLVDYPAIVEGIGEKVTKIDMDFSDYKVLLVNPREYISTQDIFTLGDRFGFDNISMKKIRKAIQKKNVSDFIANMHNSLEKIAMKNNNKVQEAYNRIKDELGDEGLTMTGSGSTLIKVFKGDDAAVKKFVDANKTQYFTNIYSFL
ncbi:MAG: 4-(cytidine 5'-diphospho)-2-C-methyl-D-erythritol kinase [Tenericutes bacterium]|nr:4-(cytidine 5'-diphospho)-2-C-methyl-D-erythritol kinase [Mycoplasmatota bacterium]